MARQIGLSAYKVDIRPRRAHAPWTLMRGGDGDGYAALREYFRDREGRLVPLGDADPDTGERIDNRAIKLVRLEEDEPRRMLAGVLMKGEAGLVQEIHDFSGDLDAPTYTLSKDEGALTPLYFRFHLADGRPYGLALLQTFGIDGLKGYLADDMRRFFGNRAEVLTVKLLQLVDARVLERFAQTGQLQDVVLINSGKTQTSRRAMERANIGGDNLGDDGDKLAMRLHKRGGWDPGLLRRLVLRVRGATQNGDVRALVNVPGMSAIDDMLVEIRRGGRTQTFSLLNPDDSPIREDITGRVTIGENGFPTWDSLHQAADDAWRSVEELIR